MVIVGRSAWPGYGKPYKAFLYSNGLMRSIGGSQSASFTPEAINDNGWITGTLGTPGGAVFWINDRIISLGTLPGFVGSEGMSLNNSGIVVGNLLGNITATYTDDGTI